MGTGSPAGVTVWIIDRLPESETDQICLGPRHINAIVGKVLSDR